MQDKHAPRTAACTSIAIVVTCVAAPALDAANPAWLAGVEACVSEGGVICDASATRDGRRLPGGTAAAVRAAAAGGGCGCSSFVCSRLALVPAGSASHPRWRKASRKLGASSYFGDGARHDTGGANGGACIGSCTPTKRPTCAGPAAPRPAFTAPGPACVAPGAAHSSLSESMSATDAACTCVAGAPSSRAGTWYCCACSDCCAPTEQDEARRAAVEAELQAGTKRGGGLAGVSTYTCEARRCRRRIAAASAHGSACQGCGLPNRKHHKTHHAVRLATTGQSAVGAIGRFASTGAAGHSAAARTLCRAQMWDVLLEVPAAFVCACHSRGSMRVCRRQGSRKRRTTPPAHATLRMSSQRHSNTCNCRRGLAPRAFDACQGFVQATPQRALPCASAARRAASSAGCHWLRTACMPACWMQAAPPLTAPTSRLWAHPLQLAAARPRL